MKRKCLIFGVLALGCLWVLYGTPSHAQKASKSLTLSYSNNFNAEIEPCPT